MSGTTSELRGWVIIWVRENTDYPTMTANITDKRTAVHMATEMMCDGTEVLDICEAKDLRRLKHHQENVGGNASVIFHRSDIDHDRSCCECGESYECDLSSKADDPVHCPACRMLLPAGKHLYEMHLQFESRFKNWSIEVREGKHCVTLRFDGLPDKLDSIPKTLCGRPIVLEWF